MTTREGLEPRFHARTTRLLFLALTVLGGCTAASPATIGSRANQNGTSEDADDIFGSAEGAGDDDTSDPASQDPALNDATASCKDEAAAALAVFENRCASCHGNGEHEGNFGDVLDLDAMVANGKVKLGSLAGSEVYEEVASGDMPEDSSRLSNAELGAIEDWILCDPETGSPPTDDSGNLGNDNGNNDDDQGVNDNDDDEDDEDDDANDNDDNEVDDDDNNDNNDNNNGNDNDDNDDDDNDDDDNDDDDNDDDDND
jgi:mono/diheme cytochrome c family protein